MFAALRSINLLNAEYGIRFEAILTDNGPEMASPKNLQHHPMERMLMELGIKHRYTRPYRPQTNGKVERFWRTLNEDLLEGTTFDNAEELKDELQAVLALLQHRQAPPGPQWQDSSADPTISLILSTNYPTFTILNVAQRSEESRCRSTPAVHNHLTRSTPLIRYSESRDLSLDAILPLYSANGWSAAEKPVLLRNGLLNSDTLMTAWDCDRLVGLGNAISDGHLVVYYPHLLVDPEYQGQGIGSQLMNRLMSKYEGFHQHILIADGRAIEFYKKCGFVRAGKTEPMWIYSGQDH